MSKTQALHAAIEWRRMADQDTYYALRDGPRLYRANWVVDTMSRYLPADHVALARRLAANHARIHAGYGRGAGEIAERVQGGDSNASREHRLQELSKLIRAMSGYAGAALRVGRDGHGCYRGIIAGDTQAELGRRVGYPQGSRRTLRKLVQITMIELAAYDERRGLDLCTEMEHGLAR